MMYVIGHIDPLPYYAAFLDVLAFVGSGGTDARLRLSQLVGIVYHTS